MKKDRQGTVYLHPEMHFQARHSLSSFPCGPFIFLFETLAVTYAKGYIH